MLQHRILPKGHFSRFVFRRYEDGGEVAPAPAPESDAPPNETQTAEPKQAPEPERLTKRGPPAREAPKEEPEELADNDEEVEVRDYGLFGKLASMLLGDVPVSFKNWLKSNGDKPISSVYVRRFPIMPVFNKLLTILTAGKFDKEKKKFNYDDMFHLSLKFDVDGKSFIVEKNQNWLIKDYKKHEKEEVIPVAVPDGTTINTLFTNAVQKYGKPRIWKYSPLSTNCQRGLLDVLASSRLLTKRAKAFIFQNVAEIAKKLPSIGTKLANFSTDTASVFDRFLQTISRGALRLEHGGMVGEDDWDTVD